MFHSVKDSSACCIFDSETLIAFGIAAPRMMDYRISFLECLFNFFEDLIKCVQNVEIIDPYLSRRTQSAEAQRHSHVSGYGFAILDINIKETMDGHFDYALCLISACRHVSNRRE